jgi:hypothetical protein
MFILGETQKAALTIVFVLWVADLFWQVCIKRNYAFLRTAQEVTVPYWTLTTYGKICLAKFLMRETMFMFFR